jgi:hypothetical protein
MIQVFQNIPEGCAIQFDEQVLVNLPILKSAGCFYLIDGNSINRVSGQILLKKDALIEIATSDKKEVLEYKNPEGQIITKEDYHKIIYDNQGKYIDDYDEPEYPDLDTEYACKKELLKLKEYEPVYTITPGEKRKFEYEIISVVEDTQSKYIDNFLCYSEGRYVNGKLYKLNELKVLQDTAQEYCDSQNLKWSNDHRDTIKFFKINGEYVFYSSDVKDFVNVSYHKTLKEAQERETTIRTRAVTILNAKTKEVSDIDSITANKIYKALEDSYNTTFNINETKSNSTYLSMVRKNLKNAIQMVETYINEQ